MKRLLVLSSVAAAVFVVGVFFHGGTRGAAGTLVKFRPRLSISLEHRPDDPDTIPGLIQSLRGDYNLVCGPCENMGGTVQPTVLFANQTLPPRCWICCRFVWPEASANGSSAVH